MRRAAGKGNPRVTGKLVECAGEKIEKKGFANDPFGSKNNQRFEPLKTNDFNPLCSTQFFLESSYIRKSTKYKFTRQVLPSLTPGENFRKVRTIKSNR